MDLRLLLKLLSKHRLTIIASVVVALGLSMLWLLTRPVEYHAKISVVANYQRSAGEGSDAFGYNNYYGTLVAQSFSESIAGMLKNDSLVHTVFDQAEVVPESNTDLSVYFRTTPKSKFVNEIRFSGSMKDELSRLTTELVAVLDQKALSFSETNQEGQIELDVEGPVVESKAPSVVLYAVIIALVAAGLAAAWVVLRTHLRGAVLGADALASRLGVEDVFALPAKLNADQHNNRLILQALTWKLAELTSDFKGKQLLLLTHPAIPGSALLKQCETETHSHKPAPHWTLTELTPEQVTAADLHKADAVVVALPELSTTETETAWLKALLSERIPTVLLTLND